MYMYAVVVSEVITHSLEIKSMISCVGGFRSQSSYQILLHYSPGTNQVLVTWPSETRQDELSNTCTCILKRYALKLGFCKFCQSMERRKSEAILFGQFKDGKIQGSAN